MKPASKKVQEEDEAEEEQGPTGWRRHKQIYTVRKKGRSDLSYKRKFLVQVSHSMPQWEEIYQTLKDLAEKESSKPFDELKELLLAERAKLYDAYKKTTEE